MIANDIFIKSLKGVGDVSINFAPDKKIRVLTGPNGIGKTKSLEAIFQALFFSNDIVGTVSSHEPLAADGLQFKTIEVQGGR